MAAFATEDDKPRPSTGHEIGQDLYVLSIEELDERISLLQSEILRLQDARKQKAAQRAAADSIFGTR